MLLKHKQPINSEHQSEGFDEGQEEKPALHLPRTAALA